MLRAAHDRFWVPGQDLTEQQPIGQRIQPLEAHGVRKQGNRKRGRRLRLRIDQRTVGGEPGVLGDVFDFAFGFGGPFAQFFFAELD